MDIQTQAAAAQTQAATGAEAKAKAAKIDARGRLYQVESILQLCVLVGYSENEPEALVGNNYNPLHAIEAALEILERLHDDLDALRCL